MNRHTIMIKELKRKDNEPLHAWIDRLTMHYAGRPLDSKTLHDLLREVS